MISLTRLIEKLTFVDFLDVPGSFIVGQISDLLLPPPNSSFNTVVLEKVGRLFIASLWYRPSEEVTILE